LSSITASYKSIWRIAYPIIIGSFAQSIISVTDTAFMGRIGSVEQAAIGWAGVYYLILFMIGFSYTKGTQILVARRLGERRYEEVGRITDNSLAIMLGFALVIFVFLNFFSHATLHRLVQDEAVRHASGVFLKIRSYGILFGYTGSLLLSFYMGIGNTRVILAGIVIMSSLNVALNYILIFGKLGIPAMGISGAAWASNIAEGAGTVFFMLHAWHAKYHQIFNLFRFRLSGQIIRSVTNLSMPIVMQTIIGLAAWMIFFTFVEKMGTQDLAVSSIIKSIYTIFGIPAWGFASAVNTLVSNLMGQQKQHEVSAAIKKVMLFSFLLTTLLCLPLALFPGEFMRFYTIEPQIIAAGKPVIYVCILALLLYAVSTIMFNGIVSTGTSKVSLAIEVLSVIIYLIYTYAVFNIESKTLTLMWSAELFYWLIVGVFAYIYLKTGKWKKKVI
jgi:MATE family multidrug resistance protein